ncbi:MAG: non-homologous end-joining DNA ligase, partial [Planctomycetota bacterium]|nr:non-homologous end-joining DNA ligase [Planctomycetota bacterium]
GAQAAWRRLPVDAAPPEEDVATALARAAERPVSRRVKLSNLDKIFWPAEGLTKGDLISYYEQVAEVLLPHIADRPIHLNRYPDGIEGKNFYQRHPPEHLPKWIETAQIPDSGGDMERYVVCNDRDTLLYLANTGSIDLHPWMSRVGSDGSPDWTVLDLDAKQSTFADVVRVARQAGRILRGIGMRPLLKTSGKTGLHVVVGLRAGYSYDQSRMFCEAVARVVAHELPDIATVERIPSKRGTKVYVDFGQNGRGQTVVPPYVARPVPGASVSAPLDWDELDLDLSPQRFTIRTLPERLAEYGDLFQAALEDPHDLEPAIERLEQYVRQA